MSIAESFAVGGYWMHLLTVMWVIIAMLIAVQIKTIKTKNYLPIIWVFLFVLFCCGLLGTAIGIIEMGVATDIGVPDKPCYAIAKGTAIAMLPVTYMLIVVPVLSIATVMLSFRVKS